VDTDARESVAVVSQRHLESICSCFDVPWRVKRQRFTYINVGAFIPPVYQRVPPLADNDI